MDASFARAVAGLDNIAVRLEVAGPLLQRRASAATRKTGADIEATSQTLVPVDTGATKNSIGSDITEVGDGDDYRIDVETGPQTSYAPPLETGTERMAPRPYMGPSFDQHVPTWLAALEASADPLAG